MNNLNLAQSFTSEQIYYSSVLESLRFMRLPDGRSFSEALTLEGIPFFDVFEAEMAWRHLTTAKAAKSIGAKMKLRVRPSFLRLKQIYADKVSMPLVDIEWPDDPVMLCLAFTGRMYQQVLEPVVRKILDGDELRVVFRLLLPAKVQNFVHWQRFAAPLSWRTLLIHAQQHAIHLKLAQ